MWSRCIGKMCGNFWIYKQYISMFESDPKITMKVLTHCLEISNEKRLTYIPHRLSVFLKHHQICHFQNKTQNVNLTSWFTVRTSQTNSIDVFVLTGPVKLLLGVHFRVRRAESKHQAMDGLRLDLHLGFITRGRLTINVEPVRM